MTGKAVEPFEILRSCAVFAHLEEASLSGLAKLARREVHSQRTLLVANRSTPQHLRYVVRGRVDLTLVSDDGRAASLPAGPGKWATWLGCFHPAPIEHEMWSAAGSEYLAFPAVAVRKAVENNPRALMEVIRLIGDTTRTLIGWALASTLFTPEKRVAYALMAIVGSQKANEAATPMRITQEQIGQMGLGTRQRVSRILKALADRGLVELSYGSIGVVSAERLASFIFGSVGRDGQLPPHPGLLIDVGKANNRQ